MILDYEAMMKIGIAEHGLHPDAFWQLTPYEFGLLCGMFQAIDSSMSRDNLNALMAAFPDKKDKT